MIPNTEGETMFQKKVDAYYFDTIVVPATEETFRTMALEGGYRYFVDSGLFTMSDLCGHFLSIWQ